MVFSLIGADRVEGPRTLHPVYRALVVAVVSQPFLYLSDERVIVTGDSATLKVTAIVGLVVTGILRDVAVAINGIPVIDRRVWIIIVLIRRIVGVIGRRIVAVIPGRIEREAEAAEEKEVIA